MRMVLGWPRHGLLAFTCVYSHDDSAATAGLKRRLPSAAFLAHTCERAPRLDPLRVHALGSHPYSAGQSSMAAAHMAAEHRTSLTSAAYTSRWQPRG